MKTGTVPVFTEVAAAVIERPGEFLLAQRPEGKPYPGYWEFPGGKIEAGEHPRDALVRELREELGIEARAGELMDSYDVQYNDGPLTRLLFYRVTEFTGEPRNLDFEQILWATRERLRDYDFLAGDLRFISNLT